MNIIDITMGYLRERQPPAVRFLHIIILCLVLSQITVSNFMGFTPNGEVSTEIVEHYATWIHICTGLSLLPIALVFIYMELKRYGMKYFFPYLYGNFSQLKKDLRQLKQFELPEPAAYGIAAVVQGLGFGALTLVVLSGVAWFLSWIYAAPWANSIKGLHRSLTGLIEAYILGHGAMGILHLVLQVKNQKGRTSFF
jgi:Prokaryotic cytochrome b561